MEYFFSNSWRLFLIFASDRRVSNKTMNWQLVTLIPPLVHWHLTHRGSVVPPFNVLLIHLVAEVLRLRFTLQGTWWYKLTVACSRRVLRRKRRMAAVAIGCALLFTTMWQLLSPVAAVFQVSITLQAGIMMHIVHGRVQAESGPLAERDSELAQAGDEPLARQRVDHSKSLILPPFHQMLLLVLVAWAAAYVELEQPIEQSAGSAVFDMWIIVILVNLGLRSVAMEREEPERAAAAAAAVTLNNNNNNHNKTSQSRRMHVIAILYSLLLYVGLTALFKWPWVGSFSHWAAPWWIAAECCTSFQVPPMKPGDKRVVLWLFMATDVLGRQLPHTPWFVFMVALAIVSQLFPRLRVV